MKLVIILEKKLIQMVINIQSIILYNKKLLPIGLLNNFIQNNVLTKMVILVKFIPLHRVVEKLFNMLGLVLKIDIEEMFIRIIDKISYYLD